MFDIHAHLHDTTFDVDRDEVVGRALALGVEKIITIGTDITESRKAVACAERYEGVYASVGIHPDSFNEIKREFSIFNFQFSIKSQFFNSKNEESGSRVKPGMTSLKEWMSDLKQIAQSSRKVVAIGECGLDYFVREGQGVRNKEQGTRETADAPPAGGTTALSEEQKVVQRKGFLAQIELAKELNLPLIVHCRPSVGTMDAYEDLFSILSDPISNIQYPVFILHCYMGDTEVTEKFLELPNVYFSFTGNITYPVKKSVAGTKPARNDSQAKRSDSGRDDITEAVKMIPTDRILAETDCPYLAPMPHRGKRNEPAFVPLVVQKIAEIQGISREILEEKIVESAKMIFGI